MKELLDVNYTVCSLLGSNAIDSSPVKAAPTSDWLTESCDAVEALVNSASGSEVDSLEPAPTFFRSFIFSPEVPIRLDYQGKRVDMEQVNKIAFRNNFKLKNCGTNFVLKRANTLSRSSLFGEGQRMLLTSTLENVSSLA